MSISEQLQEDGARPLGVGVRGEAGLRQARVSRCEQFRVHGQMASTSCSSYGVVKG